MNMRIRYIVRWQSSWIILIIFLLSSVVSCSTSGAIWILPGATAHHLIFHVGRWRDDYKPIAISFIRVSLLSDSSENPIKVYWLSSTVQNQAVSPRLAQFQYGSTSFVISTNDVAAKELTEGYYVAEASLEGRDASVKFTVMADGSVSEDR